MRRLFKIFMMAWLMLALPLQAFAGYAMPCAMHDAPVQLQASDKPMDMSACEHHLIEEKQLTSFQCDHCDQCFMHGQALLIMHSMIGDYGADADLPQFQMNGYITVLQTPYTPPKKSL